MSPEDSIDISSIALSVNQDSRKTIDHIVLQTRAGGFKKEISSRLSHGQKHKEVFKPSLELSAQDELSVSMQCQTRHWMFGRIRHIPIAMKQSEIVKEAREDVQGNKSYVKLYKNISVTIDIPRVSAAAETAHVNERSPPIVGSPHNALSPATSEKLNERNPHDALPPITSEKLNERSLPVIESSHNALPLTTSEIVDEHNLPAIESSHDALPLTTSEILGICPRFRLLIIGNTGVGKSSLISKVFGVKGVDVSNASRGKADIDQEFVAERNRLFVLHDSLGLEAAEGGNLAKVKKFVRDRRQKQELKDRLHAVWVCLQVPYAKGRLLEAGMEEFLRNRKDILGDVPVVVILTKLDLLDNTLMLTMRTEGIAFTSIEEAKLLLEPRRKMFVEEHCARLLVRAAGSYVPHVAVSTMPGYNLETTIPVLVKETTSEIERYIKADPSYNVMSERLKNERKAPLYTAEMTQRASIEANLKLTIATGKNRYWASLGASYTFSLEDVKKHLFVIHRDIIQVWNFDDPEMALQDDRFKEALLNTSNIGAHSEPVAPMISVLGPLIDNSASVVALPVAGALTLASFCDQIYQSRNIAKRFMAYIADLVYVMKILFIFAPHGSVTARDVALAFDVYTKSPYRSRVHLEVNETLPEGPSAVVEKIEALIRRYDITDEDVSSLRKQIPDPLAALQNTSAGAGS